jgi:hypothetical protein
MVETETSCNCSYGVVSVSTIVFVTVLTVWSLFLPLSCNCSYGVVSVSTIGFVNVFTVWSLFPQIIETDTTP